MISERLQETLLMLVSANDTPRFYNVAESFLVLALIMFKSYYFLCWNWHHCASFYALVKFHRFTCHSIQLG